MLFRLSLIFILSYSLILRNDCIAVAPASVSLEATRELDNLLDIHVEIKTGPDGQNMINEQGKQLSDLTYKFISNPKNKKLLNTPAGLELQKHQDLLLNYLAVKDHLEKCVKDKATKRQLDKRVLQATYIGLKADSNGSPCRNYRFQFLDLNQFENQIAKIMKADIRPQFINDLSDQILLNTGRSLVGFKYKFDPDFMKNGSISTEELEGVYGDICRTQKTNNCKKMPTEFKVELKKQLMLFSNNLKVTEKKYTPESATAEINKSVTRINKALAEITLQKDKGYIYDSVILTNKQSKKEFDHYMNIYFDEVSKGVGPLLLTSKMKKSAGEIKSYSENDIEKNKKMTQFQFTPHHYVVQKDVEKSITEVKGKILDQADNVLKIMNKGSKRADLAALTDLARINPFAAGQVLVHHPEYAGLMCESINKINAEDKSSAAFERDFTVGIAVIGGVLLLTGIGTLAGAYLLTGSLTAGVAVGTVGGSIMGYSSLASGVLELSSVTYYGKKSYNHYVEVSKIESAYLSSNADTDSILETKEEYRQYKKMRLNALIALGSASFGGVKAGFFFTLKTGKALVSPAELKASTEIYEVISKPSVAQKIKSVIVLTGKGAWEKMGRVLEIISHGSEVKRLKFLEYLQDSNITPAKLKKIVEVSLEAAHS
jgi:hypothetical protein